MSNGRLLVVEERSFLRDLADFLKTKATREPKGYQHEEHLVIPVTLTNEWARRLEEIAGT